MIIAILGRRGQGKSALATYRALLAYKKGIEVYANYTLQIPYRRYVDMRYINNAFVNLDEAHLYADARRSMSNANLFLSQTLAQCRKNRNTLFFITQHMNWLDQRERGNFDIVDICRAYNTQGHRKLFDHEKIGYVNVTRVITAVEKPIISAYRFYPSKARIFDLYDSYEVIEKDTHRALNSEEKKKLVIELHKKGITQREIAKECVNMGIPITQRTVATYIKEWREKENEKDIFITA